jgi:DNA polymerase III sliding clamp (beta) subunit (PCNA family)
MRINRIELLNVIKNIEPALAIKPIIEELTFVWFTGTHAYAYNDVIGIVVPLPTEFTGSMKGTLILAMLDKSRAKEVEILPGDSNEVLIKAANARLNLAYYGMDRSIWDVPKFDTALSFPITTDFIKAIGNVMVSVGADTSIPDQLGVTLIPADNILYMFTTDSKSLSRAMIPFDCKFENRIILPASFCEQLLRLFKDGGRIQLHSDSVVAINKDGVILFSRLIETPRPLEFHSTVDSVLSQLKSRNLVPIPSRFKLAIERVSIVLQAHLGQAACFQVNNNILQMKADTALGSIKDAMRLEDGHENIEMHVDPHLIKRALSECEDFYLLNSCAILSSENFVHLVSAS